MSYAILLAFFARFIDEPLKLQPGNPFLVAIHAGALPHVVAIARGDMGIMVAEAGECIVFAVLLGFACRSIFGSQRRLLPTATNAQWQNGLPPGYRLVRTSQTDR
jgi:hypothetical protein